MALLWHNYQLKKEIQRADTAESDARENYAKARNTMFNIYSRIEEWQRTGSKMNDDWGKDIRKYGLDYVEAVLDKEGRDDRFVRADAAKLLLAIAKLQHFSGQLDKARSNVRRAEGLLEKLLAEYPDDSEHLGLLADCYRSLPFFFGDDLQRNVVWVEKALALKEKQCRLDPSNKVELRIALGQTLHDMGSRLQEASRLGQAEKYVGRAIEIWTKVVAEHPEQTICKKGMADSYGNLALIYHSADRAQMAETAFERALALYGRREREIPIWSIPDRA